MKQWSLIALGLLGVGACGKDGCQHNTTPPPVGRTNLTGANVPITPPPRIDEHQFPPATSSESPFASDASVASEPLPFSSDASVASQPSPFSSDASVASEPSLVSSDASVAPGTLVLEAQPTSPLIVNIEHAPGLLPYVLPLRPDVSRAPTSTFPETSFGPPRNESPTGGFPETSFGKYNTTGPDSYNRSPDAGVLPSIIVR